MKSEPSEGSRPHLFGGRPEEELPLGGQREPCALEELALQLTRRPAAVTEQQSAALRRTLGKSAQEADGRRQENARDDFMGLGAEPQVSSTTASATLWPLSNHSIALLTASLRPFLSDVSVMIWSARKPDQTGDC